MQENPIEGLMNTTMNSIKDMVDVNTIIGKPIETKNGIIIPLSKVTFGFAFLVVQNESVKLLPIEHSSSVDKLLDYVPDIMEKANNLINKCTKKEEKVNTKKEKMVKVKRPFEYESTTTTEEIEDD